MQSSGKCSQHATQRQLQTSVLASQSATATGLLIPG